MNDVPDESSGAAPRAHEFAQDLPEAAPPEEHLLVKDLDKVKLDLSADLGRCKLFVRDVLDLKRGSVLHLDKLAGEMADLYVNGIPIAKGEVVVLVDSLNIRISEIHGTTDKDMM
jgi:flagellar motor switch protein FliN/FliY